VPNLDLKRLQEFRDSEASLRSSRNSAASASVIVDLKGIGAEDINFLVAELLATSKRQDSEHEEKANKVLSAKRRSEAGAWTKSLQLKQPASESNGTGTTAVQNSTEKGESSASKKTLEPCMNDKVTSP
jgi:hypothetical protein